MVTQIRKDYRSDAGLLALMGQLKVDGIKIGPEIDCTSIGEFCVHDHRSRTDSQDVAWRISPRWSKSTTNVSPNSKVTWSNT